MSSHQITREYREKQIWAVRFRCGILLGLAVLYMTLVTLGGMPFSGWALASLAPLFALNEMRRHFHARGLHSDGLTEASVIADVVTIGVIVYFTGGVESFFVPFLLVQVAGTALHVNFMAGLKTAAGGTFLFALLCGLETGGYVAHSPFVSDAGHAAHCLNSVYVTSASLMTGFALFMSALSTGYVAKRLRVREDELAEANRQLVRLYRETERLSLTDELTGAFNRRHLMQRLAEELRRSDRYERPFSLILLDVDHFKKVNDTHGHPAGDAVLKEVAARVMRVLRESDLMARYGGEEFAVLLPETPLEGARLVADRIRERVAASAIVAGDASIPVTISGGVAAYSELTQESAEPAADLLSAADDCLYRAKRGGRNRIVAVNEALAVDAPAPERVFAAASATLAHA